MKKYLILLFVFLTSSCIKENVKKLDEEIIIGKMNHKVYLWEFQGHTYIVINPQNPSFTHAGHCSCQKNNHGRFKEKN